MSGMGRVGPGLALVLVLLAGCQSGPGSPTNVWVPGECEHAYPDGSPQPCVQLGTPLPERVASLTATCSDEAHNSGSGVTTRLLQSPIDDKVFLQVETPGPPALGIAYTRTGLEQGHVSFMEGIEGIQTFSLGAIPAGTEVFVDLYAYELSASPPADVSLRLLWSVHDDTAEPIQALRIAGDVYYISYHLRMTNEDHVTVRPLPFAVDTGRHVVRAEPVFLHAVAHLAGWTTNC